MDFKERCLLRAYGLLQDRADYWASQSDHPRATAYQSALTILHYAMEENWEALNQYDYYNEEGVSLDEYQVAFCGYFPADKPKYSMIVSMNKYGLPASGGGMAGVLFHNIMEWMITHDEERKTMGKEAHKAVARYRKEIVMPQWEQAYLSVIQ